MSIIKLNEQIYFLRRQKGMTQEDLAKVLGVTNQTVSKWESAACCPDIQLLPDIAAFFDVSIDELMGYKPADTYANIYLQIKKLFEDSPKEEAFTIAFKLATLLHEGACTRGYKGYVPWNTDKDYTKTEECYRWGASICSEPEGVTVHKANSVFISDNKYGQTINNTVFREVYMILETLSDRNTLRILFDLHELTAADYDLYLSMDALKEKSKLTEEAIRSALNNLPIQTKDTDEGQHLYRLEGYYMHIPLLLIMLGMK